MSSLLLFKTCLSPILNFSQEPLKHGLNNSKETKPQMSSLLLFKTCLSLLLNFSQEPLKHGLNNYKDTTCTLNVVFTGV